MSHDDFILRYDTVVSVYPGEPEYKRGAKRPFFHEIPFCACVGSAGGRPRWSQDCFRRALRRPRFVLDYNPNTTRLPFDQAAIPLVETCVPSIK